VFDLNNETLNGDFKITIEDYKDSSSALGYVKLSATPDNIKNILCRKITKLRLNNAKLLIDKNKTKVDPIELDFDNGFVHAKIGDGSISFDILMNEDKTNGKSWFKGFIPDYNLTVSQLDSGIYKGLDLLDHPLTNAEKNLSGQHLNLNDITVGDHSFFILNSIGPDFASFWLSDEDIYTNNKTMTLNVQPILQVTHFEIVHVDITSILIDLQPGPIIIPLGEESEYVDKIKFNKIGVKLDFGELNIEGLALMISAPEIYINELENYYPIESEGHLDVFVNNTPQIVDLGTGLGSPAELCFKIGIKAENPDNVITIYDLYSDPANIGIKFSVIPEPVIDWEYMDVNLSKFGSFNGSFPRNGKEIDLSFLSGFMDDFEFANLESYLYISGPDLFFNELNPSAELSVVYKRKGDITATPEEIIRHGDPLQNAKLPAFDLGSGKYTEAMPLKGKEIDFDYIISNQPKDLRFNYEMKLGKARIENDNPEKFKDINEPLQMLLLIKMPMDLLNSNTAPAKVSFTEMAKDEDSDLADKDDLFGRSKDGDSLMEWIKSLTLRLDLNDSAFSKASLYLNDGKKEMLFPISGQTMTVDIKGDYLDHINNKDNIPFIPDIGILVQKDGAMQIARDLAAVNISFEAEIIASFNAPWSK
jgi:hypothetical protein